MARSSMTRTLKYAMDVPRAVTGDTPTSGLSKPGRSLGLHKSTVSGLLATMEQRRLVRKDPVTDRYRLGLGALELAATRQRGYSINNGEFTDARAATAACERGSHRYVT
jgi:DNA-binding IclR family transcriptional regulator